MSQPLSGESPSARHAAEKICDPERIWPTWAEILPTPGVAGAEIGGADGGAGLMNRLAGRIVIITGAAGASGHVLANTLAAGGDVVVAVDLPGSGVLELARGLGRPHIGLEYDVSKEEDILALYRRVEAQFAQISVLVNNAAIGPTMDATVETSIESFRRTLAVNLIGPFVMAREAARRMQPGAVIVNVASISGIASNPKRNAYGASKARPYLLHEIFGMRVGCARHSRDSSGTGLCAYFDDGGT